MVSPTVHNDESVERLARRCRVFPQSGCLIVLVIAQVATGSSTDAFRHVICWGRNNALQAAPQSTAHEWTQIAGGLEHSVALDSAGQIRCWGSNSHGQCSPPPATVPFVAIAAGWHHSIAVTMPGRVVAWGRNSEGQASPPAHLPSVSSVAAGARHSAALLANGSVRVWGDNSDGQSTVPPNLPTIAHVACGGAHTLALSTDGRVFAWGNNEQAASGLGLARVRQFLVDATSGVDSVDIVTIGDSNTGYSEGGIPIAGWTDGLCEAMVRAGIPRYATPLQPISPPGISFGVTSWNSPMLLGASSDPNFPAVSVSGTDFAPESIRDGLRGATIPNGPVIRPTGVPFDFAWIPAQQHAFSASSCGLYLWTSPSFPVEGPLTFRVVHSVQPASGPVGHFTLMWLGSDGQLLCPPELHTTIGQESGWHASELSLQSDPLRTSPIRGTFGGGGRGQGASIRGPCGLGLSSVYRPVRGFAVQSLDFHGGATMTQVADDLAAMPQATVMTWLREIAERQRSAGGTGKALFFIQGGINADVGLPDSWGSAIIRMKSVLKNAWLALGNSESSIGFVIMVSHAPTLDDAALSSLREYSRSLASVESDVCAIDLSLLTNATECSERGWFSPNGSVHLTADGYVGIANRIVGALRGAHDIRRVPDEFRVLGGCVAIASGQSHAIGVLPDGRVIGWGTPQCGATDPPPNAPAAESIAAGGGHSLLRTADGEVVCWGDNGFGQSAAVAPGFRAVAVAAGRHHSLSITHALPCPADLSGDGRVTSEDLVFLLAGWGTAAGDIDGDGTTSGLDVTALMSSFGPCGE